MKPDGLWTQAQALDFAWSAAGAVAAFLSFGAVILLALSLIGMIRR